MRNPIRVKNLRRRFFLPFALGVLILSTSQPTPGSLLLGSIVVIVGLVLRGWGAGFLVKNDALTTTGPYAHMRHPLYAGTLWVGSGFGVAVNGAWALVVLGLLGSWFFGVYFPRKDRVEGERLEALFGESYVQYRAAVPALWPRWSGWSPGDTGLDPRQRWSLDCYSENNELGTAMGVVGGWLVLLWRFNGPAL